MKTNEHEDGRDPLPRRTTPTWEMELLLSGATVFSLLQLPVLLDAGLNSLMPRFDRDVGAMILLPFVYVKSAVQVLAVTFLLHLVLRGYWIALVGLRSVHPDGIAWDGLRWGPIYLARVRDRMGSLSALVERADNRASLVFGYGIGFALTLLAPLVVVGMLSIVGGLAYFALDGAPSWKSLTYGFIALLLVPYFLIAILDRALGRRLSPERGIGRAVRRAYGFFEAFGFSAFVNYPVTLFVSRVGKRRGNLVLMLALTLLVGFSMIGQIWDRLGGRFGQYGPLASADIGHARTLHAQHYADRRSAAETLAPVPFIPSLVANGDYLPLFLPFRPQRDLPAMRERCPDASQAPLGESVAQESAAIAATLDCLARLYPMTLDGAPIADLEFDATQDPVSGLRGVQAMIRVVQLPPGRHELRIGRPRDPDSAVDDPREVPFVIPFWR